LDTNGTGYLCTFFTDPRLYRVLSWRLSDYSIEFKARCIDAGSELITTSLKYSRLSLDGMFGGLPVKLYSEREWQSHALPAQERIAKYRNASLASPRADSRNSANRPGNQLMITLPFVNSPRPLALDRIFLPTEDCGYRFPFPTCVMCN
jgi:hypothetical protein